ncbi:hypothetical protein V6N11_070154 [Hibiscus sabdariffa]|uniref:Uncharacterized protein n=1 Tax=Hibiscus sabdariffa TaxID=183260 RepID=A0ABR2QE57_9ROSI
MLSLSAHLYWGIGRIHLEIVEAVLINVFAPNAKEHIAFWDDLAELKEHVFKLWAGGGVFNVVYCKSEQRQIAELE